MDKEYHVEDQPVALFYTKVHFISFHNISNISPKCSQSAHLIWANEENFRQDMLISEVPIMMKNCISYSWPKKFILNHKSCILYLLYILKDMVLVFHPKDCAL
jgi:hypothetical protein